GEDDSTGEGPTDGSCDVWEQDCPEGEKCAAYANEKSDWWNDLHCVPVPENPAQIGDPCYAPEGPAAGIDDCDHGAVCWDVDEEGMGTCLGLCTGSAESPSCSINGDVCVIANAGVLNLCLAGCDPLLQDCGDGQGCYPAAADGYVCAPDDSARGGGYAEPCEYINVCDAGLFCTDASNVPGCMGAVGCCSEYCDLSEDDPDAACSGAGQICVPHFDPVAPGFEDAGGCVLP
ncbi:MAG: ribulose phosphate epimerase, partial [Myxococcota bacterium]